jgi:feruloyl esterase
MVGAIVAGAVSSQTRAQPQLEADAGRCAGLAGRRVESGVVETAATIASGGSVVGGETAATNVPVAICRVRLHLSPAAGSDIRVEVWLPAAWNRKLYGIGGAGFDGSLNPGGGRLLAKAVGEGYAAVATDAGHKQTDPPSLKLWAHGQPERVVDFGHRANHLGAVAARQLIAAYYGGPPSHAYFLGCSNGGRDGLMEASRYPEDYDGVVAGAPARRYVEVVTQMIVYSQIAHGPGGAALESKLNLVNEAILRKCDALDGVNDGVIENPRDCHFDPAELQCKGGEAATCLTADEVAAYRKIHAGPRLRDGELVIAGPSIGAEDVPDNWNAWITGPTNAIAGQEFYGWIVHDDPTWKVQGFQLDRDYAVARSRTDPIIDAESSDLRAFAAHGGKLIIYQGWGDPAITPEDTLRYYEAVRRRLGPKAAEHVRLFMVPGMGHCASGPGATSFDMQPALERWVEHDHAPDRIVAVKPGDGASPLTHPLCAWPQTARYAGSGSTRDAVNFRCKAPRAN